MLIDHIFIFTDTNGKIADELISFGLTANESRVHKGQGTTNRTFSFENFFLEIAWVHSEKEIKSDLVKSTGLWKRAEFFQNSYSPFGLILVNNQASDHLFKDAYKYQPEYFPAGMEFEILLNDSHPDLPFTCRMPLNIEKNSYSRVINHKNRIKFLTRATFEYYISGNEKFLHHFENENSIKFLKSDRYWLTLNFDNGRQSLKKTFDPLFLTIEY